MTTMAEAETELDMSPDEILICNVYDLNAAIQYSPRKVNTLKQRMKCALGFHIRGFTHCLCCGKRDVILWRQVMREWAARSPAARNTAIRVATFSAHNADVTMHGPVYEQLGR